MMRLCLILLFASAYGQLHDSCEDKVVRLQLQGFVPQNSEIPCPVDPCDTNTSPLNDTEPCPGYCGLVDGKCLSKSLNPEEVIRTPGGVEAVLARLSRLATRLVEDLERNSTISVDSRSLPGQDCSGGLTSFIASCGINFQDTNTLHALLEPPVNIPYCLRIPCPSNNPSVQTNSLACQSIPGCYFDQELFYRRQGLAYASMPGVPVCHRAIRNTAFLQLAAQFVEKTRRPWNPLYTKCLIEQNLPLIEATGPGCPSLRFLLYIGVKPKIQGWRSITRRECFLINGCYVASTGPNQHKCFYPVSTNQLHVQPGEDPERTFNPTQSELYGQQICQRFNTETPQDYLSSYHHCRQSGCVVAGSVNQRELQHQFLNLVLSPEIPESLRPQFWVMIQEGTVTPGNWEENIAQLMKQRQTFQPFDSSFFNTISNSAISTFNQNIFQALVPVKDALERQGGTISNGGTETKPCSSATLAVGSLNTLPTIPTELLQISTPGVRPFVLQLPLVGNALPSRITPLFTLSGSSLGSNPQESNSVGGIPPGISPIGTNPFGSNPFGLSSILSNLGENNPVGPQSGSNLRENPLLHILCPSVVDHPTCPYHSFVISGYPNLKGSFEGCCEKHLCYIPRSQLHVQYSGIALYWGDYREWSQCSASCGGGRQTRNRVCMKPQFDPRSCEGEEQQTRNCNVHACDAWGDWGEYGVCNVTCGEGRETRERSCIGGTNCTGNAIQTRECYRPECPEYGPWGPYTPCACGRGTQYRRRTCIGHCDNVQEYDTEENQCELFCGAAVVTHETRCNHLSCEKVVTYTCRYDNPNDPGGIPHCHDFRRTRTSICFDVWPCIYCPRHYTSRQCRAYVGLG